MCKAFIRLVQDPTRPSSCLYKALPRLITSPLKKKLGLVVMCWDVFGGVGGRFWDHVGKPPQNFPKPSKFVIFFVIWFMGLLQTQVYRGSTTTLRTSEFWSTIWVLLCTHWVLEDFQMSWMLKASCRPKIT